jgi:DNA-cytosine methyltransferase
MHALHGSPNLNNKANPLDELFFILLSLKTSHRTYEDTYRRFRKRFHPWSKLLRATPVAVERYIKRGGLGSIRARAFIDIARRLQKDFGEVSLRSLKGMTDGEVDDYLRSLPGIGIKTARCVAMYALGRDVTPVDTHTYRVGVRLGIVPPARSLAASHQHFDEMVPPGLAHSLHTNFVAHGRNVCVDPVPRCNECPVSDLCHYHARSPKSKLTLGLRGGKSGEVSGRRRGRPRKLVAADIYSGCGGLSQGLRNAGMRVAYAVDWDAHACETHRANAPETIIECNDVSLVDSADIAKVAGGRLDILSGGPNCQGLSQLGLRSPDDPRNFMLQEFARLVSELRPRMFLFENVPGLAHRHNFPVLKGIFDSFEQLGYRCSADVLLAADYGVPQLRYRFFMIGTLDPHVALSFPLPTHGAGRLPFITVDEAIGDLPRIDQRRTRWAGPVEYHLPASNSFQRAMRGRKSLVHNHVIPTTASINLERIRRVPEGGNWKDIPAHLLPPRLVKCRMTDHSTTYGRLSRCHPSFTITSVFGNVTAGAFTHPTQDRALSIREGARLQGFPDNFVFHGPRNAQAKQIGNAVPPLLAHAVADHMRKLLLGLDAVGQVARLTPELIREETAWDALPILTPRFMPLFGAGTKWPVGWGPADERKKRLNGAFKLQPKYWALAKREID